MLKKVIDNTYKGMIVNMKRLDNYLENKIMEYGYDNSNHLIELYEDISNERLKVIFSKMHYEINGLFKFLNSRLSNGHYTAHESRMLIKWIDEIEEIQSSLKKSDLGFTIDPYYKSIFEKCSEFLNSAGGSPIPSDFKKITLKLIEPIFEVKQSTVVLNDSNENRYSIKLIAEGSYAQVFKYKDEHYNKFFAIKRALKGLTKKEYERFQQEFEEMNSLNSPYIVEVYRFDNEKQEYIMEYIDKTLLDYVKKYNNKLTKEERKSIVLQVFRAFDYIHSKGLLHRDISLTNIMVKKYDELVVIKVSDFGLVKIKNSNLTSLQTEFKGSLNDPDLGVYGGFKNYSIEHETYALTRLIYFIMTGRIKIDKFENEIMKEFILRGLSKDLNKRFKGVSDMREAFLKV